MKVAPFIEEVVDLRHKIHIMNAENFLKVKNEHIALVNRALLLIPSNPHNQGDLKEKVETIRRKGAYFSVRGEKNFVRYTKNIADLNNTLRYLIATLQTKQATN